MLDDRALNGALSDLRDTALARSRLLASEKPAAMDDAQQRTLHELARALDDHVELVIGAASEPTRLSEERALLYAMVSTFRMMSETAFTSRAEQLVSARFDAASRQLRSLRRQRREKAKMSGSDRERDGNQLTQVHPTSR